MVLLICLNNTLNHYHHHADVSEGIESVLTFNLNLFLLLIVSIVGINQYDYFDS